MLTWFYRALRERITSELCGTDTHRCVAHHTAFGIESAGAFARISAFLIHAGQMEGTLAVANTLWPTIGR